MPIGLSGLGVVLSLVILFASKPAKAEEDEGDVLGNIDPRHWRRYKFGQGIGLLVAMTVYALAIFPIGFIASTTLFLIGSAMILGERRFVVLIPVSLVGALVVWYLVQEVLGVFLRPWPGFLV